MDSSKLPEPSLLKSVLEPLLDDFQYWFERSCNLLEGERIEFLSEDAQVDLLDRVTRAQEEVSTAQMMFRATDGKAGVEMSVLMPWHNLLAECWKVSMRQRADRAS